MKWVSILDSLPPEEKEINTLWFDVWSHGEREVDVKFYEGNFYRQVLDYQGDYSHDEKMNGVTHWLVVEEPIIYQEIKYD